jgi:alkylation response protein AidB-like acyl-CoA dehydrogenase
MAELANERSGPERYLSSFPLFAAAIDHLSAAPSAAEEIGRVTAELFALREMSVAVARTLGAGKDPSVQAALVKDLGATLEQEIPGLVQRLTGVEPNGEGASLERGLAMLTMVAPLFSLRGGTREILRSVIARSLAPRP